MLQTDLAIRIVDLMLFFAGIFVGVLICTTLFAIGIKNVYISPHTKGSKMVLVKIKEQNEEIIYVNPETFKQSLEIVHTLFMWLVFKNKERDFLLHNKKRQDKIFMGYIIVTSLILIYACLAIFGIQR